MVIFNLYGVLSLGVGIVIFLALESTSPALAMPAAAAVACVIDLVLRLRSHGVDDASTFGRLLWPRAGGHVWFIPVWMSTFVLGVLAFFAPIDRPDDGANADQQADAASSTATGAGIARAASTPPPPPPDPAFCKPPLDEKSGRTDDGLSEKFCVDEDGRRQGPYEATFGSGQRATRGWYVDGRRDGAWSGWHDNGQLAQEATFKDDVIDGRLRVWDPSGALLSDAVVHEEPSAPPAVTTTGDDGKKPSARSTKTKKRPTKKDAKKRDARGT